MGNRTGEILRERRLELGLTQEEVALELHMSIHQYQRYEYGEHLLPNCCMRILPEGYSKDVLVQLDILSESSTSNRDRRVSEVLRSCLAKGTLLRRDYEERGYTGNMWLSDTALATQLGLITKQPDGGYIINRELQTEFSNLKPHQKKAITAIYEAFGYDAFSSEMFVATLNYSVSYTYASLHKLTLLRILEQKVTDEGCQYQLLVNPEDHPECFIEAA